MFSEIYRFTGVPETSQSVCTWAKMVFMVVFSESVLHNKTWYQTFVYSSLDQKLQTSASTLNKKRVCYERTVAGMSIR